MAINIRVANKEDMSSVLGLIQELAVFEHEPHAVTISVSDLENQGFGPHPMFTCFVAEHNSTIVGIALVYFRFSTWVGKTLHLEDLVVSEAYRGKRIGGMLYRRVMQYAKEQQVNRVNWVVLGWNKGAIRFYERTGANVMDEWWQVEMDKEGIESYLNSQ